MVFHGPSQCPRQVPIPSNEGFTVGNLSEIAKTLLPMVSIFSLNCMHPQASFSEGNPVTSDWDLTLGKPLV